METNKESIGAFPKRSAVFIVGIGIVSILSTIIFAGIIVGGIGLFFYLKTVKRYNSNQSLYKTNTKKVLKNGLILNLIGFFLSALCLIIGLLGGDYYKQGVRYLEEKKYQKAIESFKKVKVDDKKYSDAMIKLNQSDSLQKIETKIKERDDSIIQIAKQNKRRTTEREQALQRKLVIQKKSIKERADSIIQIAEQNRRRITEKEQAQQEKLVQQEKLNKERNELIQKQFSDWDGSHKGLEKLIKENMPDPRSYEHVETKFIDKGDYILVFTKFRGKNGFGGMVFGYVTAKVDFEGNVIEIVSQK